MAAMLFLGGLLTVTAIFRLAGPGQVVLALAGQVFWILAYLDWQRGRWAPKQIRKFRADRVTRVPCQIWVVVEGVGVMRDAGVLVQRQAGISFEGIRMGFILEPKDIELVEEPNFGSDARCIVLKGIDFQLKLKFVPYWAFDPESKGDFGRGLQELMFNLSGAIRMQSDTRPARLPDIPFQPSDWRHLGRRAWWLRLLCVPFIAYALADTLLVPWANIELLRVAVLFFIAAVPTAELLKRANASKRASDYIRHAVEGRKNEPLTSPESETLNLTS